MGVCDGNCGCRSRHQSIRRAERLRGQGENQRHCSPPYARDGKLPEPAAAAQNDAVTCSARSSPARRRPRSFEVRSTHSGPAITSRFSHTYRLRATCSGNRWKCGRRFAPARTWRARSASGPRYLHSTGQYHKGGPNTALAFVITADDETQTEIPEAGYTFSVLKRAQALGDVQTLEAHDRRTVRMHVKDADAARAHDRAAVR